VVAAGPAENARAQDGYAHVAFRQGNAAATGGKGAVVTNVARGRPSSGLRAPRGRHADRDADRRAPDAAAAARFGGYALNGGVCGEEARRTGP